MVRNQAFRRDVVAAYGGRCAMCGLNFDLVQAAHIHPVAATDSRDEVWNGLCLCPNHHQAFDAALIWVDPDTRTLRLHPRLRETTADNSAGDRAIADTLFPELRLPTDSTAHPRPDMFRRRYDAPDAADHYRWVRQPPEG